MSIPTQNPADAVRSPHRIRMRTIVIGLAALTVSVAVLIDRFTAIVVQPQSVALILLIGAGALLIGNGVLGAVREQRARQSTDQPVNRS